MKMPSLILPALPLSTNILIVGAGPPAWRLPRSQIDRAFRIVRVSVDNKRFWDWDSEPIEEEPTPIQETSTETRRQIPPDTELTPFSAPTKGKTPPASGSAIPK